MSWTHGEPLCKGSWYEPRRSYCDPVLDYVVLGPDVRKVIKLGDVVWFNTQNYTERSSLA